MPQEKWARLETWLISLIALHSFAVGFFLLFFTRWGTAFGGWPEVTPLFFARQAGIFHFVVATGYMLEFCRYRRIDLLLTAKSFAVVFLTTMALIDGGPWTIWLSAIGDACMGLMAFLLHREVTRKA